LARCHAGSVDEPGSLAAGRFQMLELDLGRVNDYLSHLGDGLRAFDFPLVFPNRLTSTVGNSLGANFDENADSNELVTSKLTVNGSTVSTGGFTTLQTAPYGQVLRGVALVPNSRDSGTHEQA
jgi:hypothetical protein